MVKVELEKFICALMPLINTREGVTRHNIEDALEEMGLEYNDDGQIVDKRISTPYTRINIGDWVVCVKGFTTPGHDFSVGDVLRCTGYNEIGGVPLKGNSFSNFRPWTIQDAKDGDVLSFGGWVGIFEGKQYDPDWYGFYCSIDTNEDFDTYGEWYIDNTDTYPATKEQRKLLFDKMHEAGYEWDADKKELRTILKSDLDNTNGTNTLKVDSAPKHKSNLLTLKTLVDQVWHSRDMREKTELSEEELESLWHWLDVMYQEL